MTGTDAVAAGTANGTSSSTSSTTTAAPTGVTAGGGDTDKSLLVSGYSDKTSSAEKTEAKGNGAQGGGAVAGEKGAEGKTTESKTDDGAGEKAKASDTAATPDIDIKLPEGVTADEALLTGFKPIAKELGLDSAKAQKLVDLYTNNLKRQQDAALQAWQQQDTKWVEAVKADPEIGGSNLDTSLKNAQAAFARFATPAFVQLIQEVGLGNHPEMLRAFVRIGKALAEDSVGSTGGTKGKGELSPEEARLRKQYPTMFTET